jgi:hypothetical protein
MTKKNIQCSLVGMGRMAALRAQGRCGFDGVVSSGRRGLEEDDSAVGPRTAWVNGVTGSGTAWGAQHHGLGEGDVVAGSGMTSWAWGRCLCGRPHHRHSLGKMATRKGFDCGWERWCGGSGEDSTTR